MKTQRIFLLAIAYVIIVFVSSVHAYDWPVEPFNQQHQINSSVGEPRPIDSFPTRRFHAGADIGETLNTPVFAIEGGTVTEVGSQTVRIGTRFRYVHITPLTGITMNAQVTAYQQIGRVNSQNHLHLEEYTTNGILTNPLLPGHLQPFVDNVSPAVWNTRLYRDTTAGGTNDEGSANKTELTGLVYGKIDIRSRIQDQRVNPDGSGGGGAIAA